MKRYVEIDRYQNILFHKTNQNKVQNSIHNSIHYIAFKQKEKAKKEKFELKSKKEKIVTKNLKKEKLLQGKPTQEHLEKNSWSRHCHQ